MLVHLRRSFVMCVICLVFFGFVYAFAGTGVAQVLFKQQADGSLTANGSTLIGQPWNLTKCPGHPLGSCVFQGRPDDLGPYSDTVKNSPSPVGHPGDDPLYLNGVAGESASTALGPRSKELLDYTKDLVSYWHARGVNPTPDLVTTSGSGYDPDISQQDAIVQIPMVSKATGISPAALRKLIAKYTNSPELGFLGAQYIDVLRLNEGLAKLKK
ncbi:MAG: potassium-transporting ATPase subunit C [Acidimicrobiales bacterium]